ncbi:hypothetical protein BDZ89DRAFT_1069386 [Hymenopellis radicata]|nr:hypothetical protein BDZ89DRAFT_1069386 [Hymenopellis radicata]
MEDLGFLSAGYEYISLDDCWSTKERDSNGLLVPNSSKFPSFKARIYISHPLPLY